MKVLVFSFFLSLLSFSYLQAEPATKEDIKIILDQMDKRFEQVDKRFEQVDKRFEQIDKRFEQVDKRFDQLMWIIALWIPIAFGIVFYILRRIHAQEDRVYDIVRDRFEIRETPEVLIHMLEKANPNQRKRIRELIKS